MFVILHAVMAEYLQTPSGVISQPSHLQTELIVVDRIESRKELIIKQIWDRCMRMGKHVL